MIHSTTHADPPMRRSLLLFTLVLESLDCMPDILEQVRSLPQVSSFGPEARWTLWGIRTWVRARKQGQCPLPILVHGFADKHAAVSVHKLVLLLGKYWESRFHVAGPCATMATFDEALIAQALEIAQTDDDRAFHALFEDMFNADEIASLRTVLDEVLMAQRVAMMHPVAKAARH